MKVVQQSDSLKYHVFRNSKQETDYEDECDERINNSHTGKD